MASQRRTDESPVTNLANMTHTLVYDPSEPSGPVRLIRHDDPSLGAASDGAVSVKFLASPVNRVDLMVLSGKYPVKPHNTQDSYPIPGFDGCGIVTHSNSAKFSEGDLVIPKGLGLGTWRSHAVLSENSLLKLPPSTPVLGGALLRSGALIAWLLLEAIKPLQKGDSVIISAGTSTVAYFFVQLARLKGVSVIVIIRDRALVAAEQIKTSLLDLGAAQILTESELAESSAQLHKKPVLALDSVYGRVGQLLADTLVPRGTFVLVGLLAGPGTSISISTEHLFTKQLCFIPFRGSEVLKNMGDDAAEQLISHVAGLFVNGSLKIPELTLVPWRDVGSDALNDQLQQSLERAKKDEVGSKKTVWVFS